MSRRRDDRLRAARTGRKRKVNRQPVIRPDEVGQTGGPASLDDALLLQWIESRVRAGVKPSVLAAYALLAGAAFTGGVTVPDEAYGSGWNGSTEVPTKNALYDKIQALGGVTSVGATAPISSSGGATPNISTSMATGKLIGRTTAGTGVMEEITVGTGLSLSGGTLSNSGFKPNYFGNGGDGSLTTSSGTTSISVPKYYTDVTISGTASLSVTGAFLHINGTLDITNAPAAAIVNAPNNGSNAAATVGGGGGGAIAASYLPGSQGGGAGPNGGTGAGTQASAVGVYNPSMMLSNAAASGGKGGNAGANNGGAARACTAPTQFFHITWFERVFAAWTGAAFTTIKGGPGAAGGSSGAGDGTAGGGGGGGGGGAGQLWIAAKTISRGGSTAASAIKCVGGNGGNGGVPAGGNRGGGGGGCGAGVGWVDLTYYTLIGSTATNSI